MIIANKKMFVICVEFLCMLILLASPAFALTIGSSTFNESLNDGAYITESTAASNLFSQELLSMNDSTAWASVAISEVPYFDFEGSLYFQFVYDMQETGPNRAVSIDSIGVHVGDLENEEDPSVAVWTLGQDYAPILLNSVTGEYTDTPLGAGGDMELYVPVSLFHGQDLTGSDILSLLVTQSQSDNGGDEWVVLGSGSGGSFFGPDDSIGGGGQAVIPEPSTILLLGAGLVGLAVWRKKH